MKSKYETMFSIIEKILSFIYRDRLLCLRHISSQLTQLVVEYYMCSVHCVSLLQPSITKSYGEEYLRIVETSSIL